MSGEQLTAKEINSNQNLKDSSKKTKKVNINSLLNKVRQEKDKERKENYIFVGLICGVVAVTGFIASF
tara:strand:- start:335 stop:538 length:204 start_codon:yes stop_codon:yes gene_type:complete